MVKLRVIAPFLQVYRGQLTSTYSVLGRVSGFSLSFYFLFFVNLWSLKSFFLTYSYNFYSKLYLLLAENSLFFYFVRELLLVTLVYHFFFGLRYLYFKLEHENKTIKLPLAYNFFYATIGFLLVYLSLEVLVSYC